MERPNKVYEQDHCPVSGEHEGYSPQAVVALGIAFLMGLLVGVFLGWVI